MPEHSDASMATAMHCILYQFVLLVMGYDTIPHKNLKSCKHRNIFLSDVCDDMNH
jgi:hypothetical protein